LTEPKKHLTEIFALIMSLAMVPFCPRHYSSQNIQMLNGEDPHQSSDTDVVTVITTSTNRHGHHGGCEGSNGAVHIIDGVCRLPSPPPPI
jgi:hypothetical protein